jgi:hypothetical protein
MNINISLKIDNTVAKAKNAKNSIIEKLVNRFNISLVFLIF